MVLFFPAQIQISFIKEKKIYILKSIDKDKESNLCVFIKINFCHQYLSLDMRQYFLVFRRLTLSEKVFSRLKIAIF